MSDDKAAQWWVSLTAEQKELEAKARDLYPIRPRRFAVEMEVFKMAWEHGHSGGHDEVLSYYCDFAGLAQVAMNAVIAEPEPTS